MITVGIATIAAAVALALARALRLPAPVLAIVLGVALNVSGTPLDASIVRSALLLSATFLVFVVGAEIDRGRVAGFRRTAVWVTLLHLAITGAIVAAVGPLLDLDLRSIVYLALALGGSSTLLVMQLLRRRERVYEPLGRLLTATIVTQDVTLVVALSLITAAHAPAPEALPLGAGAVGGLAVASWAAARSVVPHILERRFGEEERLLMVLALLFAFAGAAWAAGLPLVVGAYFAGLSLSRFPAGGLVRGYLTPFSDFFTALFFVLLAVVAKLPAAGELLAAAILVAAVLLLRPLVLVPLVRATGLTVRSSIEAVTLLGQSGELALIVALVAIERGHASEQVLTIAVIVVMVTMSLARWTSSDRAVWRLTHAYPSRRRPPVDRSGHLVLIGAGETGRAILEHLPEDAPDVVIVDDDPAVVQAIAAEGRVALRGDGGDRRALAAAAVDRAAAIVSTMPNMANNAALLEMARGRPVFVRVFSEAQAELVRARGGHAVAEAEVATERFLRWYRSRERSPT